MERAVARKVARTVEEPVKAAPAASPPDAPRARVLSALHEAEEPLTARELRKRCRMRTAKLADVLRELVAEGAVIRSAVGLVIAPAERFPSLFPADP